MNHITIAIEINERQILLGASWPTRAALKALARLKLARLKYKAQQVAMSVAMVIIPLPSVAA